MNRTANGRLCGRVRYVGGLKFVSDRPGWWFSECGRFTIFRMLAGTIYQQWELYRRGKNERGEDDDCQELISYNLSLRGLAIDRTLKGVLSGKADLG